jgi:cell division protease FtsH
MTRALMEWETIDADQIADIMADRAPRPPKPSVTPPPPSEDKPSAPAPTIQPAQET